MNYKTLHEWFVQPTSTQAYYKIRKIGLRSMYGKILRELEQHPSGLSIGEIAESLNIQRSTISPRISELREIGVIRYLKTRSSKVSKIQNMTWVLDPSYKNKIEVID